MQPLTAPRDSGAHSFGPRSLFRLLYLVLLLAGLVLAAPAARGAASDATLPNTADYVEVDGVIDPSVANFLARQIRAADDGDTGAVLLRIDTPGALDASVEPVLEAMAAVQVPVVVWVAPGDAQAGGAGAALVLAADWAVMTERATIGPMEPLDLRDYGEPAAVGDLGTGQIAAELAEQVRTDTLSGERARELGVVDSLAPNVQELLQSLKGLELTAAAADGSSVRISEDPLVLSFMKMGLLERLSHAATQPAYAYLIIVIGLFGLLFELYNPGVGGAAVFGAIFVGFGLYALTILPTSWIAVALLFLGFGLLKADLGPLNFGIYSWSGLALVLASGFFMYPGAHPALQMPIWAPIAAAILCLIFFVQAMTSAISARTARPIAGSEGVVDAVGVARTDIAPDGQVMARGTLWRARTLGMAIPEGTNVKVLGMSGLTLMVEPTDEAPDRPEEAAPSDRAEPEESGS